MPKFDGFSSRKANMIPDFGVEFIKINVVVI